MTKFFIRRFIKDWEHPEKPETRKQYGIFSSIIGILSNVLLFAVKGTVGFLSGSVAITAEAFNNLSDSLSSIVTLLGFILGSKPPDREHPFGHKRFEYISGLFVSVSIIFVGVEFFKSSMQKIIHPEATSLTPLMAVMILLSIFVKVWQSRFNEKIGTTIHSSALLATSADSMNDVLSTTAVLICAVIEMVTHWKIDGYVGLLVAISIIISGLKLIKGTIDELLGTAPELSLVKEIEDKLRTYPIVGFHDLIIHTYGPDETFATVHVEVPASDNVMESHELIDKMERDFKQELSISLVIHMDPVVLDDPKTNFWKEVTTQIVHQISPTMNLHDFRMVQGKNRSNLIFDVVVPFTFKQKDQDLLEEIQKEITAIDPSVMCVITFDRNYIGTDSSEFS